MADVVDIANEYAEQARTAALNERGRYSLPAGVAGECEHCGRETPRLVKNLCAPCRDELGTG